MSISLPGIAVTVSVISLDTKVTGVATAKDNAGKTVSIFIPSYFGGKFAPYPRKGDLLEIQCDRVDGRVLDAWHVASNTP